MSVQLHRDIKLDIVTMQGRIIDEIQSGQAKLNEQFMKSFRDMATVCVVPL